MRRIRVKIYIRGAQDDKGYIRGAQDDKGKTTKERKV
jgi:hypothetical protein